MAQPYSPPCQESLILVEPCPEQAGRLPNFGIQTRGLIACILASSMAFIDGSALTVALPALKSDLEENVMAVQWVLNGYILALAALTMIGGSLVDTFGRSRMLTWGCVGFAVASAACASASGALPLILSRVAQGAAAAIVTPASLALIGELFAKSERSKAIGVWAAASALTTAGGPVLGGWLVELFGWRAVFWINLPIAAVAIALLVTLQKPEVRTPRRFDVPGSVLLALGLLVFALAMSFISPFEKETIAAEQNQTPSFALLLFCISAALFTGFWLWQQKTDHPLLPSYIFRSRTFTGLNLATLALYAGLSIMFFLLPFELMERRGLSPIEAGLVFLPFTLCVGLLSRSIGAMADKVGVKPLLIAGSSIAAAGFIWFAFDQSAGLWRGIIAPMTICGLGFAALVAPLTTGVLANVDDADEGLASGINNTVSRIAQMVGVAIAALFASTVTGYVTGLCLAGFMSIVGAFMIATTFERPKTELLAK